ncbi:MAG: hypothetical protein Fur005_31320 [Roseiflexaceae bacterium]
MSKKPQPSKGKQQGNAGKSFGKPQKGGPFAGGTPLSRRPPRQPGR